ncbi:MAG: hypothetical protein GWN51_10650 [Gemmatimonadetes bacterium]|nr:hypothetical protein [Gemmatimonadota bacterium]NIV24090.1 hypothetical protein [Gemmatimonadota bacterium]NIY44009.1 hypothetical protein [Gemmatimonadota bacterium]
MRPSKLALVFLLLVAGAGCGRESEGPFPLLTGAYLGQTPPGDSARLFAPGIVSNGMFNRDLAMTPDGNEMYWSTIVGPYTVIMSSQRVDGRWTRPRVAPFSNNPEYMNLEPHIAPDGQRFYFLSNRPRGGGPMPRDQIGRWVNQDIWVMDRLEDGWGAPYNLGPPVNSEDEEYFPSVTRDGTIYFTRAPAGTQESYIYRSRRRANGYAEPERLPAQVNSGQVQFNAFVAPDESYVIVSVFGRSDSMGGTDYYIVFRSESDEWSEPINMGQPVNSSSGGEYSAFVSPDGQFLFFMSARPGPLGELPDSLTVARLERTYDGPGNGNPDIYWIGAGLIDDLRARASWGPDPESE